MKQALLLTLAAAAAIAIVSFIWLGASARLDAADDIRSLLIPAAGTETAYGIPLSLASLPQFVGWWTTLVPAATERPEYIDALTSLVAPCCDDNTAFHCCCESGPDQSCNLIRSAKGLAAHLVLDLRFTTDQVRASVLQWLQFARPDYYVAAELAARGLRPASYGLTTQGSCYRGLCGSPISKGGCGGMDPSQIVEPAISDV